MAQLTARQMEGYPSLYHSETRRRDERSVDLEAGNRPIRLWDRATAQQVRALPQTRTEL